MMRNQKQGRGQPMKIKHSNLLRDSLYNLNPKSGANTEYCKGIVIGTVSALMAMGFDFQDALAQVCNHLPEYRWEFAQVFPDSWLADVRTITGFPK
jgi:hypothetical protein